MGTEFFAVLLFATATLSAPLAAIAIVMFFLSHVLYRRLSSNDRRPSLTLAALEMRATSVDRTLVLHGHPGATDGLSLLSQERLRNSSSLQDRGAYLTLQTLRDQQDLIL